MGLASLYAQEMLGYIVMGFPVYVLLRLAYLGIRRVRPTASREVLLAVCVMYGIGLVSQTLLPHGYYGVEDWRVYAQTITSSQHSLNVVPFRTIWGYAFTHNDQVSDWGSVATMNLLANVLLFMPLGFLMPLVRRGATTLRHALVIGAATAFAIEGVQFFIGRSADIDDLLLNVLGVLIGYAVLAASRKMGASVPLTESVESS